MPQMAPYNWLNLYFMFSLILFYLITFFNFMIYPNKIIISIKLKKNYYYWNW